MINKPSFAVIHQDRIQGYDVVDIRQSAATYCCMKVEKSSIISREGIGDERSGDGSNEARSVSCLKQVAFMLPETVRRVQ